MGLRKLGQRNQSYRETSYNSVARVCNPGPLAPKAPGLPYQKRRDAQTAKEVGYNCGAKQARPAEARKGKKGRRDAKKAQRGGVKSRTKMQQAKRKPIAPLAPGLDLGQVSVATAARLLRACRRTIQYMLKDGRLEGTRIPPRGWWQVNRESLTRLVARTNASSIESSSTAPTASRTASNGTLTVGKENAKDAQPGGLTSV